MKTKQFTRDMAMFAMLVASLLCAPFVHASDNTLAVGAAYENSVGKGSYHGFNVGATFTMPIYKALEFCPQGALGWREDSNTKEHDWQSTLSLRPLIKVNLKNSGIVLPISFYTGPRMDVILFHHDHFYNYDMIIGGPTDETEIALEHKRVSAYWMFGAGLDFGPVVAHVAYSLPLTGYEKSSSHKTHFIEVGVGYKFAL